MEYVRFNNMPFSVAIPYNSTLGKATFWIPVLLFGAGVYLMYRTVSYSALTKPGAYGNKPNEGYQ